MLSPEFEITQRTAAKLSMLSVQLGVDSNDPDRWWKSFCLLAFAVVPGMDVVFKEPRSKPKSRDNKFWNSDRYRALVSAIDAIRGAKRKCKLSAAAYELATQQPSVWGKYTEMALVARYHEGKRGIRRLAALEQMAKELPPALRAKHQRPKAHRSHGVKSTNS